jgi:DNA-binding HxlR family transcriptional regulator
VIKSHQQVFFADVHLLLKRFPFEVMEMERPMKRNASLSDAACDQRTRGTREEALREEKSASLSAWNVLGKRRTFQILRALLIHPQSFQELFNQIEGMGTKALAQRLKELEGEGVLRRESARGRHVRVVYCLTAKGEALEPVIRAICLWSQCL